MKHLLKFTVYFLFVMFSLALLLAAIPRRIHYLPFDIPGELLAVTIPPVGTLIENSNKKDQALQRHEAAHWAQYDRMGCLKFYSTYFKELVKYGRKYGPIEQEAREFAAKPFMK